MHQWWIKVSLLPYCCCCWCGWASRSNWVLGCGYAPPCLAVRPLAARPVSPPHPRPRCPTRCFLTDTRTYCGGSTRWMRSWATKIDRKTVCIYYIWHVLQLSSSLFPINEEITQMVLAYMWLKLLNSWWNTRIYIYKKNNTRYPPNAS